MEKSIKTQKFLVRPAHPEEDFKSSYELNELRKLKCIHCGAKFEWHTEIIYTRLSNNKLIWWHDHQINDYD